MRNNLSDDTDQDCFDDEENEEDLVCDQRSLLRGSGRKLKAVHAAINCKHADRLLDRHPGDTSLLMYHDKCSKQLQTAMTRLHAPERKSESRGSERHTVV